MDLFQGGILTGEKIKIKNKNSNSNINNTVDNNSESENQGTNSALNPGQLKRRHSSTLFAPKHAGMEFYFSHNLDIEKLWAKSLTEKYVLHLYNSFKKDCKSTFFANTLKCGK